MMISIHALLAESDPRREFYKERPGQFLSTLSLRRATPATRRHDKDSIFLSTLSLRRATMDRWLAGLKGTLFLSTLSLRRATRVSETLVPRQYQFLSTLSLRRATAGILLGLALHKNFYPRSPCGERRLIILCSKSAPYISIHALLAESDANQDA